MRFTRKLVRQQPWWLLVGVLAFFLLSSFTTAAPAQALIRRADEVQPAGASPAGGSVDKFPFCACCWRCRSGCRGFRTRSMDRRGQEWYRTTWRKHCSLANEHGRKGGCSPSKTCPCQGRHCQRCGSHGSILQVRTRSIERCLFPIQRGDQRLLPQRHYVKAHGRWRTRDRPVRPRSIPTSFGRTERSKRIWRDSSRFHPRSRRRSSSTRKDDTSAARRSPCDPGGRASDSRDDQGRRRGRCEEAKPSEAHG